MKDFLACVLSPESQKTHALKVDSYNSSLHDHKSSCSSNLSNKSKSEKNEYMNIIYFELRKYELDGKKIIAVIDTTFAVVKRKPE